MAAIRIKVRRIFKGADYTIGKLYLNDKYFCDTIEDTDRGLSQNMSLATIKSIKKPSITAIPTGTYKVDMNTVSPKYASRSAYVFCGGKLPRLQNVPGYDGVLIHIGNYPKDTAGCILVGVNSVKGAVMQSTATFKKLYAELQKSNDITLTIE